MKHLNDKNGMALIAYGTRAFAIVNKSTAANTSASKPLTIGVDDTASAGKYTVAAWGSSNALVDTMETDINKLPALRQGLKYKRDIILGQGIYPCIVQGYDDKGNEILQVVNDPEIRKFIQSPVIRNYMAYATRDLLKFGSAFPQMLMDATMSKIVGINVINARHCRYERMDQNGTINNIIVSGTFPNADTKTIEAITLLDTYDPELDILTRKALGKLPASFIYPMKDNFDNATYYPAPDWYTAVNSGWFDVATQIPSFINAMYSNQASFKYQINIPESYLDEKFPLSEFKTVDERATAINEYLDNLIENVTDVQNANKAIATTFRDEINKIEIKEFSQKWSNEQIMTSAVANSEIFAAIGVNPAVRGLMPGNSVYAGNQGGSNIREAFLIDICMAWAARQQLLDPIELMLRFNGASPDIELRFQNVFLTTLDTGGGTGRVLS